MEKTRRMYFRRRKQCVVPYLLLKQKRYYTEI